MKKTAIALVALVAALIAANALAGTIIPTPSVSSCGGGAAISGHDGRGAVLIGSDPPGSSCTITFARGFDATNGMACLLSRSTSTGSSAYISAASGTGFVISSTVGSASYIYDCSALPY